MKLKLVRLKGEIMIAGIGTLKTTVSQENYPQMDLEWAGNAVIGKFKGVTFGIPLENIVVFVCSAEQA